MRSVTGCLSTAIFWPANGSSIFGVEISTPGIGPAIVGLMARHLSRLQTFPLFYYGLNYMLGVEAWIIAPLFALGRSSVQLARLPFVVLNAVVAVWLIARLSGQNGLRPALAFVAAL